MASKLGLIARMDDGGLANETWETYRHLNPYKTLVVDLSELNGNAQHPERFPDAKFHKGFLDEKAIDWITDGVDTVLTYEIPYNYDLFAVAREKGVKSVLRYNYEFLDYLSEPAVFLPEPDVFASPSSWHLEDVKKIYGDRVKMLFTPVDRGSLPFREINQIRTFVHIAGVKLFEDRNGTELLLKAIPLVKSSVKFIIYSQHDIGESTDPRVEVRGMEANYWDLYQEGDCLVLPRRYGGQTLQMNEAMSVGMIPIMLDCDPNNTILNQRSLVKTTSSKKIMTRALIDCYDTDPQLLADKIDEFADMPIAAVAALNQYSNRYAESISWENLLPQHQAL